jgi:hypothetical protein
MQYDRVFPVAMPGELHIPPIWTVTCLLNQILSPALTADLARRP